jgi:EAL domain-containing protein (putative c-di-GMP-specific phosphodiesterase class I)
MMLGASGFAEEQLGTFLQNLEGNTLGWQAVHLHFSKLSPSHRRESTVRIALNGPRSLVRRTQGKIFLLFNFDVVMLVKGVLVGEVIEVVEEVRGLFQDEPLSRDETAFSTWYDLSVGFDALQRVVRNLAIEKSRLRGERQLSDGQFVEIEPLDPARLFQIQQVITSLDISSYVRRQPVCAVVPDEPPRKVFEEIYVHIADLQKPLLPNVNLAGNRWLFQHLTQSLDLRVLAMLTHRPGDYLRAPVSLNLNVDTLLSQSFLEFDRSLKEGSQKQIVIEVQPVDMFADFKAFQFGREFLRSKGYRLCLDGLKPDTLVLCDRRKVGVDLLKLHWDAALAGRAGAPARRELAKAVRAADPKRVILTRCDEEAAVATGHELGIGLFQGHYIDEMLVPGSFSRN